MSSPNSAIGGGFHPYPHATTLGYSKPRSQRTATLPSLSIDGAEDAGPRSSFPRHRLRRGLSFDEVRMRGIISPQERSITDFRGLDLCDSAIKTRPRKLRKYYENLALIQDHYEEVDSLLAGELPAIIASTFAPPPATVTRSYTDLHDVNSPDEQALHSAWHVRPKVRNHENGNGEEALESTPLLIAEREARRDRIASLALNINTIVNVLLVAAKVVAVYYSSSISLTASLVDSALDLLSTFIILGTSWAIGVPTDRHRYPAGKRRFEPLGVLIFSVVMIASFVQVLIESFQRLLKGDTNSEPVELNGIGMATMLATIAVKAVLWVWCSRIPSSGVQALAQDAENDVFFNIMSLAFPYLGHKLGSSLLDPIGGCVLSLYIIVNWIKTLLQNFANLSGRGASSDQYTRVLYLVSRFNPVLSIADVECYHIGDDLVVEIDVILPNTSLHFAHDVGETIQVMLENLDGVLRAYVHTDYTSKNPPQHIPRVRQGSSPMIARQQSDSEIILASSATPTASNPFGTISASENNRSEGLER